MHNINQEETKMILFGKDKIATLFYGRKEVIKVMGCDGQVVWQKQAAQPEPEPPTPTTGYFTTVAKSGGTITFSGTSYSSDSLSFVNALSYSTDSGATWSEASQNVTVSVAEGTEVWWKGVSERGIAFNGPNANSGIGRFSSSIPFDLKGNIMSLIYGDSFEDKTSLASKPHALLGTFFNSRVVDASELILPATEFYPLYGAYRYMFYGCTSLTEAPQLLATTLVQNAYEGMFQGCTSLTEAPELPATTLASSAYARMFDGCTSLSAITCLATDLSAYNCLGQDDGEGWVNGVAAEGTFTKVASVSWPSGISGIPSNWTVVDA